jgi:hypothetical protein
MTRYLERAFLQLLLQVTEPDLARNRISFVQPELGILKGLLAHQFPPERKGTLFCRLTERATKTLCRPGT